MFLEDHIRDGGRFSLNELPLYFIILLSEKVTITTVNPSTNGDGNNGHRVKTHIIIITVRVACDVYRNNANVIPQNSRPFYPRSDRIPRFRPHRPFHPDTAVTIKSCIRPMIHLRLKNKTVINHFTAADAPRAGIPLRVLHCKNYRSVHYARPTRIASNRRFAGYQWRIRDSFPDGEKRA